MAKMRKIREQPVAYENWTRPEERGPGSYLIEAEGPEGVYVTDFVSYKMAGIIAKRRTQYHQNVRLTARLDAYDPPALD